MKSGHLIGLALCLPSLIAAYFGIRNIANQQQRPIGIPCFVASIVGAALLSAFVVSGSTFDPSDPPTVLFWGLFYVVTFPVLYLVFYVHGIAVKRLRKMDDLFNQMLVIASIVGAPLLSAFIVFGSTFDRGDPPAVFVWGLLAIPALPVVFFAFYMHGIAVKRFLNAESPGI